MEHLIEIVKRFFAGQSSGLTPSPFDFHNEIGMTFMSAMAGAALGVIGAGLIQLLFMILEHRHARKELDKELDRKATDERDALTERERTIAFTTVVKASQFSNRLISVLDAWKEQLEESGRLPGADNAVLWQRLYPVSGIPRDMVRFDVEQVALVLKMGEEKLANDMLLMSERYASLFDSLFEYNRKRAEMKERMPVHVQNRRGVSIMSEEMLIVLSPYIQEVTDLSAQLCSGLTEDLAMAVSIYDRLGPACRKYFRGKGDFTASTPDEVSDRLKKFQKAVQEILKIEGTGFVKIHIGDQGPRFWVPGYDVVDINFDDYRPTYAHDDA